MDNKESDENQGEVVMRPWYQAFKVQLSALLWKNMLLSWRNKRSTLLRIIAPFIFMLLVWMIDKVIQAEEGSESDNSVIRTPKATFIKGNLNAI